MVLKTLGRVPREKLTRHRLIIRQFPCVEYWFNAQCFSSFGHDWVFSQSCSDMPRNQWQSITARFTEYIHGNTVLAFNEVCSIDVFLGVLKSYCLTPLAGFYVSVSLLMYFGISLFISIEKKLNLVVSENSYHVEYVSYIDACLQICF